MAEGANEQANLYRALADVAKQVGQALSMVDTKPSFKEMMAANTETRKECAALVADAVAKAERHFQTQLDAAAERMAAAIGDKVTAIMAQHETAKIAARKEQQDGEAEVDRRVRVAMRTGWVGIGTGGIGVLAAIAQGMGWNPF